MKIAVVYNKTKPQAQQVIKTITKWARKNSHELSIGNDLDKSIDLLLALGGDGTMLRAIREADELGIPTMGINLGGLGFLIWLLATQLAPWIAEQLGLV